MCIFLLVATELSRREVTSRIEEQFASLDVFSVVDVGAVQFQTALPGAVAYTLSGTHVAPVDCTDS